MTERAMLTLFLAYALAAVSYGASAEDTPPAIAYADAAALSPHDLAVRSFEQLARSLTDKMIQPSQDILDIDPSLPERVLYANFTTAPVAAAPGLCRMAVLTIQYEDADAAPAAQPTARTVRIQSARANAIQSHSMYAVVGAVHPKDRIDDATLSACAKLKAQDGGFFLADSGHDAALGVELFDRARTLAAATDASKAFSFSCIGTNEQCTGAQSILAKLATDSIDNVWTCFNEYDYVPGSECVVVKATPDRHRISLSPDRPNYWYLRIENASGKITVGMKPDHDIVVAQPL